MVLHKKLDYGTTGCQVPPIPLPKSAKGKRSSRKRMVESRMCAFDLLAAVAGKLLLEGEGSLVPNENIGSPDAHSGKDTIKSVKFNDVKPVKDKSCGGNCCENTWNRVLVAREQVTPKECSQAVKSAFSGSVHVSNCKTSNKETCTEKQLPYIDRLQENNIKGDNFVDQNASSTCSLESKMDVDAKPHTLAKSNSRVKVSHCGDHILYDSLPPKCQEGKLLVDRDDDENSSGCTNPRITINKAVKPEIIGQRRSRKQLATKFWKVATTMAKDRELSNTDVDIKTSLHRRICYTRQRTHRVSFKRRKIFQHRLASGRVNMEDNMVSFPSAQGHLSYPPEDFHVKLRIKSFKVPELFVEIPETSTVGSLKRTVMEAVTAILGGGLHVGVLLQGKKVRDDNKTLVQAGLSRGDNLDDLGFILEPNSSQSLPLLTSPEETHLLLPNDPVEPLTRFPVVMHSLEGAKLDASPEALLMHAGNYLESTKKTVLSPPETLSFDKAAEDVLPLIAIPSMSVEALPMDPVRKSRRYEVGQRRIRRPFSVSEVEALVQAVEKLGTGRWRDVKIRAFDNAKHRTYVDLKDKWKTLVHTARISPQQRRGEPVPQELLDRVLSAHAYWSQPQAKLQSKAASCLQV